MAAAATSEAPKRMLTVVDTVKSICRKAEEAAFPNLPKEKLPVSVAVTTKAGLTNDFQNNSAMALFGMSKKAEGGSPYKSPAEVATALIDAIRAADDEGIFEKLEPAGGFINIWLSAAWQANRVMSILQHGVLPPADAKRKVVVDFSSPNVAKEMHVGHLRSTIIGDTICRMLSFCGHEVVRVNHVGDWGTQFGMLISHLKAVFPDYATKPPPIGDLQQFYKDAKKIFDEDEDFKKRAHEEVVRLQGGDGASRFAWNAICEVSRREFEKVYSRLDVKLTEVGESFYNEYIPPVLNHLSQIGVVTASDGARVIWPKGTKQEQPLIVQKGDGGFGYDSTDMAAIWYRLFQLEADQLVYVTDAGQAGHFELVFAAAVDAGWVEGGKHRIDHVPFGLVCGPDGKKYKTRSGEVVRLVDLLDEAVSRMYQGMVEHNKERVEREKEKTDAKQDDVTMAGMGEDEMKAAAKVLGYGAVKYADLKGNRNSNYIFDYDRMLDPKGDTAVYMLYTGARLASILRKAGVPRGSPALAALVARAALQPKEEAEMAVTACLIRFQEVLERAVFTLLPNYLCDYLYELCGKASVFVRECKVLGVPEQDSRLLLCSAILKVIESTLDLLGIGFLDRI